LTDGTELGTKYQEADVLDFLDVYLGYGAVSLLAAWTYFAGFSLLAVLLWSSLGYVAGVTTAQCIKRSYRG
jgi:hypothetical protein